MAVIKNGINKTIRDNATTPTGGRQGLVGIYRQLLKRLSTQPLKRSAPAVQTAETSANASLHALTAAAIALPGMMLSPACAAEDDDTYFQYGYYEEGQRFQLESYSTLHLQPIHVDNLSAGGHITLLDRLKFAFNYTQDTWSGATPLTTAPAAAMFVVESGASMAIQSDVLVDQSLSNFYRFDPTSGKLLKDDRKVHMMTMASPETRKQGNFKLGYEWDEAALDVGGGVSVEDDYNSYFLNSEARWDFNRKLTSLNAGLSYTDSLIRALRDPQYSGYIDYTSLSDPPATGQPIRGEREDWAVHLGLTQVLGKNTLIAGNVGYIRSNGFLGNPYKVAEFLFVDPSIPPDPNNGLLSATTQGVLERRPDLRNQWTTGIRFVQYVPPLDASLHFDYNFFHDDWGINAHTFELAWGQPVGKGWTITPRFRYYTQSAAGFYRPYFLFNQARPRSFNEYPIQTFSSDHRLSGYGALSGGVTINKVFAKGIELQAGFEYYTHQGGLKLGAGDEAPYANFSYYLINTALKVDLSALANIADAGSHSDHVHSGHHSTSHAPAGVMFDHMLDKAGDFMIGYRFMYETQDGDTLHGAYPASDQAIVTNGCGSRGCSFTPVEHSMYMHMFNIMYAPTDWLNLMLMPQLSDMTMSLRTPEGAVPDTGTGHNHGGTGNPEHATGGLGDTGLYAMIKLFQMPQHHLHMTLGVTAPSGDSSVKLNNGDFIHYGMQLGSGTWDFNPSLTYTGHLDRWGWGAQISGVKRLQKHNSSGFAFGDIFQSTLWGSYNLYNWLSASIRGVYTLKGDISGSYNGPHDDTSPVDFPGNYGGEFWDVGFGLNATVTGGQFQGHHFSFEWLQPVKDDVNGYQLQREGGLFASWSLAF
ncbi:MAG: DUF3570 domain-containing protein [Gammaproteobacteria bacterium]